MVNVKFTVFACLVLAIFCVHYSNGQVRRVRSLRRQCIDQGFAGVCRISTRNPTARNRCSQQLQCAVVRGRSTFKQAGGRIPDGTSCGTNRICMNRRCVAARNMPEVVGTNEAVNCGRLVSTADRIQPRPLQPLSP